MGRWALRVSPVAQAFQPVLLVGRALPAIFFLPLPPGERGATWPSSCNQPKRRHPHPNPPPSRGRGLFPLVPKLLLGNALCLAKLCLACGGWSSVPATLMVGSPTLHLIIYPAFKGFPHGLGPILRLNSPHHSSSFVYVKPMSKCPFLSLPKTCGGYRRQIPDRTSSVSNSSQYLQFEQFSISINFTPLTPPPSPRGYRPRARP